jgi:hypothetical protein
MAVLARWVSPWSRFTELQRETHYRGGVQRVVIPGAAQLKSPKKVPVQIGSGPEAPSVKPASGDAA